MDVSQGEACDDGNNAADDGCSPTCEVELGFACAPSSATLPSTCTPCPPGAWGRACVHACAPCYNGGGCNAATGTCDCPVLYHGRHCEELSETPFAFTVRPRSLASAGSAEGALIHEGAEVRADAAVHRAGCIRGTGRH